MTKIHGWSVARSGAAMTISGKDAAGDPVKVTGVKRVDGDRADGPVAVLANGDRVQLA